jgi:integrase
MYTSDTSLAPPATLAEVQDRIAERTDINRHRRRECISAINVFSRIVGLPATAIAADAEALRYQLKDVTAAGSGLRKRRLSNLKSLLNSALTLTAVTSYGCHSRAGMTGGWKEQIRQVSDRRDRWRLSRLARECSLKLISPENVTDAVIEAFRDTLTKRTTVRRPRQALRETCLAWNRAVEQVPGWPQRRLSVPNHRRDYAMPLSAFPASLATEVAAFLDHCAGSDLFSDTARFPLSPATIRHYRSEITQLLTALVFSGREPQSISSLSDLVDVAAVKEALNFFWERNGRKRSGQLQNFMALLIIIAKHWVKVSSDQLNMLRALRRRIWPGKHGMTERNQRRLSVFTDPKNVARLVNLPAKMVQRISRAAEPTRKDAVQVQLALAIALVLIAPVRAKNLAALHFHRHFVHSCKRTSAIVHLVIPAEEVKNKTPLEFELPHDVVQLLDLYLRRYHPLLDSQRSGFIFTTGSNRPKDPEFLAKQVQEAIKMGTGFILNLHSFRHFAAYLFLSAYPGEYETVRLLLGHKNIATTVRFYCGLERAAAFRRYDALIDRYRGHELGDPVDD